jgi:cell division protein FtsQ
MGSTRRLVLALAFFAVKAGRLYLAARETSVFAVREVEVTGPSQDVVLATRAALEPMLGQSLVALDPGELVRRLQAVPTVRHASIDRDFPHTLSVTVEQELPVAVVRAGDGAWLVSAEGRILERVGEDDQARLPRVWLGEGVVGIAPGKVLPESIGGAAVRALARIPVDFHARVEAAARGSDGSLVLVLPGELELRLGGAAELRVKLEAAAAVLGSLTPAAREELAYLDVSLPARPVGAVKSQLAS